MLNLKCIFAGFLIALILGSFIYTTRLWINNKEEILIQAADFFETMALPYRIAKLTSEPADPNLLVPIRNLPVSDIEDSWGYPRSGGRTHEGIDMFSERGTPVYSATEGYVLRAGHNTLGGNIIFVIGRGGYRYYYAHLDKIALGIDIGTKVTTDTVLGYVGNTGNAEGTPPHLHFGMYQDGAHNPYSLLVDRK